MKRQLKRTVENVTAALAPLVWGVQRGPSLLVLMYHRVLPADHPDRKSEQAGMYVSPQSLDMHLGVLEACGFSLMHLDDWLQASTKRSELPARACALTFDDGWRDNYDYAFPILKKWNAPATIYLVADLVGTRYSFWPNRLARVLAAVDDTWLSRVPPWLAATVREQAGARRPDGGFGEVGIDRVICACKARRSDAEMMEALAAVETDAGARDIMSWSEIQEMKASGLVRFGSHTRRHTRLSTVSAADVLRDEVIGSGESIESALHARPATFCYPNGDTSPEAVALVRSRYHGAVTTQRGWHRPEDDPFLIRRIGVHEDVSSRPAAFLARVSGWL